MLILHSCSSITTESKKHDINDIIYPPSRTLEREIAEGKKNK